MAFLDHHQTETRRAVGYFPSDEFLAELRLALGMTDMLHEKFSQAFDHFHNIADRYPQTSGDPEALYCAVVAAYQRDGKPDPLFEQWRELRSRYPESTWWTRASFVAGKL